MGDTYAGGTKKKLTYQIASATYEIQLLHSAAGLRIITNLYAQAPNCQWLVLLIE
jgi:hypothetical protein